jgi:hypothetical protein
MHLHHLRQNVIRCAVITAALFCESFGYFPDSSFLPLADSLFAEKTDTQLTVLRVKKVIKPKALRVKKETHTYFMVTTCKTIEQPISTIVNKLRNTKSYPDYFSFITRANEIDNEGGNDPVSMFVGGYGIYRIYFFGKIREEMAGDSTRYRVFCGNVEQKKYRKAWKKKVRGMVKIGSYDTDIFWTVEKRGASSSRVSLTASQSFTTRTPNWMVSIGTNKIFRGMLKDLETYLVKNNPVTPGTPATIPETPTPETAAPAPQSPTPTPESPAPAIETPAQTPVPESSPPAGDTLK